MISNDHWAGEVWKKIPSLPGYMASSAGRLMRTPYEAPMPNGGVRIYGGTPHFGVWDADQKRFTFQYKGKTYRVSKLVCEAFHGEMPFPEAVAMHLDEDSTNNQAANLQWGTQKENLNFPGFLKKRSELSLSMWAIRKADNDEVRPDVAA